MNFFNPGKGVVEFAVRGQDPASRAALDLIRESRWFELTPCPDDEWSFQVKDEVGVDRIFTWVPGRRIR